MNSYPRLGATFGSIFALLQVIRKRAPELSSQESQDGVSIQPMLILYLIFSWVTTLVIYTYAGERMPWITVHLTLPMILVSGWWFGAIFTRQSFRRIITPRAMAILALSSLVFYAFARSIRFLIGMQPTVSSVFQGLEKFTGWALPLGVAVVAILLIFRLARRYKLHEILDLAALCFLALLLFQTTRSAFRAAYTNYDSAKEYLVYAHAAPGPKLAMTLVEELSLRTTGEYNLPIGYDNDAAYPLWWYLRNYPQAFAFGAEPNRTIRDYPVVFASDTNAPSYEAYLGDAYQSLTFERLWWPREDYSNLTWQSIRDTLANREMLRALWDIWFNRDYARYSQITGHDVTARGWQPAGRMKMYIRNDYASGVLGVIEPGLDEDEWDWSDPYSDNLSELLPEIVLGGTGSTPGFFSGPRGLALDPTGLIYVTDSNNHRIQVIDPSGELQGTWGFYADSSSGEAASGGFNQPWDLTIASDGSVIVVDTWNHRIQRFTADGEFLQIFDAASPTLNPSGLYGPRGIAIDQQDRIFVVDTGNKRVLIFNLDGLLIGQFGSGGLGLGNLDEPVGLAFDSIGRAWIADTWNQRVQVFEETYNIQFEAQDTWPIEAWFGQSIENKPYVAISPLGHVCVTDPEGGRVLCFTDTGEFQLGFSGGGMILPSGIAFDEACHLWIADAGSDQIMRFDPDLCQ